MATHDLTPAISTGFDISHLCLIEQCQFCRWLTEEQSTTPLSLEAAHIYERASLGCLALSWILTALEGHQGDSHFDSISVHGKARRDQDGGLIDMMASQISPPGLRVFQDRSARSPRWFDLYLLGDEGEVDFYIVSQLKCMATRKRENGLLLQVGIAY